MIELEIGSVINNPKDQYELYINTYSGDMDNFNNLKGCVSREEIIRILTIIDRMKKAYPHGRGGMDSYSHVKGFTEFDEQYEWPHDGHYFTPDTPYWCDVFYYDTGGIKHKVKINGNNRHFF